MKKIFCELCDGTEFVKESGMFICQGCGTKYTAEEAKAMMREVAGDAPSAVPAAGVPMGNANQQQIDNLLVLASNAFESSNNTETESYCNKIIEMDVTCYKAWLLKGQAIGWESTYGSPRVDEGANALRKAVDFAPEEERESVAKQALSALCRICSALASLAQKNFSDNPTDANRLKFGEFLKICDRVTDMFCDVSPEVKQFATDEFLKHKKQSAEKMNLAAVAALGMVRKKWKDLEHPNKSSFDTYLDWCGEIRLILDDSIKWGESVDESPDALITRYKNLAIVLEEPIGEHSWKQEWVSYASEFRWFHEYSLTDAAVASRRADIRVCQSKIKLLETKKDIAKKMEQKKAEEARRARIEAYWEAHAEEKAKLEAEKSELTEKKEKLTAEITELTRQIEAEKPAGRLPSEIEFYKIGAQIKSLTDQRAALGLFAGKEKKRITEEIATLQGRQDSLKNRVEEEKKAAEAEREKKLSPLKTKKAELKKQAALLAKRISAIDAELNKDPEE